MMDLEADISVPLPHQQQQSSSYSLNHDTTSSSKLKLGANGTPVTAVEEAAAAVAAASRTHVVAGFIEQAVVTPQGAALILPPTAAAAAASGAVTSNGKDPAGKLSSKPVRYRECQKNHAAGIGGHALDGCGEFMPSGEEGSIEALKCSACDCHRNFHRREVEGEVAPASHPDSSPWFKVKESSKSKKASSVPLLLQHTSPLAAITPSAGRSGPGATLMALSNSDQSDEQDGAQQQQQQQHHSNAYSLAHHLIPSAIRKRFRTKFTNEQKEKMYHFADRLGWKIQKHDEVEVQQFCAEVGVKRHVLKVWMHNNKNTFGKKLS